MSNNKKNDLSKVITKLSFGYHLNNEKEYQCRHCLYSTPYKGNFSRHQKTCSTKKLSEVELIHKNEIAEKEKEFYKREADEMKKIVSALRETLRESIKDTVKESESGSSGSFSLTGTLYGELKNNPALEEIEYKDIEKYIKPTKKLIREVMACYKGQTLHELLGRFILLKVKKKNLYDQSIFSSDTSRQTYYIKEMVLKNESEWILDKQGTRVKKILITPLTNFIMKLVDSYYFKQNINMENMDLVEKEMFIKGRTDLFFTFL